MLRIPLGSESHWAVLRLWRAGALLPPDQIPQTSTFNTIFPTASKVEMGDWGGGLEKIRVFLKKQNKDKTKNLECNKVCHVVQTGDISLSSVYLD